MTFCKSGGIPDFPTVFPTADLSGCCFVLQFPVFPALYSIPVGVTGAFFAPFAWFVLSLQVVEIEGLVSFAKPAAIPCPL
jgi:hypothetical protein